MRSLTSVFWITLVIAGVFSSQPAQAQASYPTNSITTISESAAATLLAPYFEVDLNNATGMNTIISVNNTGAGYSYTYSGNPPGYSLTGPIAVLAHVTVWSDLAVPVFNFNVYLTGYDVQKIDMRRVLNGLLPATASAGQDPGDTISPKGRNSQDINFASCNTPGSPAPPLTSYPWLPPPAQLSAAQISNLQTSLTGQASPNNSGQCAGRNLGDNIARGYVTIDTVNNCTSRFPSDTGYFGSGGSGDATNQVQLTGEVYYIDQLHSIARGGNLVHIHADSTDPLTTTSGNYIFYGRYDAWTAADNRQPLPTNFAARYLSALFIVPPSTSAPVNAGQNVSDEAVPAYTPAAGWGEASSKPASSPNGGTSKVIVWRDPKVAQGYFTCGSSPSWYPLGQEGLFAIDEQEHPQGVQLTSPPYTFTLADLGSPFPAATQSVLIGGSALPVTATKGWLIIDLNTTVAAAGSNPPIDSAASQGWVQVIEQSSDKLLNVMHNATQWDSGTAPNHVAGVQ